MADNKPQNDKPQGEQKPQAEHQKSAAAAAPLDLAPVVSALDRLANPSEEALDRAFRRQIFLAVLNAYVARHGCFDPREAGLHAQNCWECADIAISMEDAKPREVAKPVTFQEPPKARSKRPVHPNDEWGVILANGVRKRGFQTEDEANDFAAGRPDSRVVQITGPEMMAVSSTM